MAAPMRLAPCVQHWVMIKREAEMQIDGQFIHCAAFVGKKTELGFYAEGTCFFLQIIEDDWVFTYAITASHVIRNLMGDVVSIRVQSQPNRLPKIFKTKRHEWVNHPDAKIDICAYTIDWRTWNAENDLDIRALTAPGILLTPEREELFGFGIGSEIFIPSAFTAVLGEQQNIPVVRFGHVAAMALEPVMLASPKTPAFLVETRSLGGMSGSPVMFHTDPTRGGRREPFRTDPTTGLLVSPYFLIGMLQGVWSGQYPGDFIAKDDLKTDAEFNSGISVVIPISQVMEVIKLNELRKRTSGDSSGVS